MSYREMRTFTEIMRSLGFPRLISMENFRKPNFPLVAEILAWLVMRYDSHADIPQCLDTEQDRVLFVKMIAHFMVTRACIRLNTKKLYQANGFAVKELLKIAKVLYSAMCENKSKLEPEQLDLCVTELFDVTKKKELQEGRSLSGQLASCGASLHALLGREVDLREARDRSIRRQLDSEWVEKCVARALEELKKQIEKTEASLVNVSADEANLDEKIEKKRNELERNRKRLSTLQSVRPAYMEEYEQLEEELGSWYSFYLTRFRNLAYLENQYEELLRAGAINQGEDDGTILKTIAEHLKQSGKKGGDDGFGKSGQLGSESTSHRHSAQKQSRQLADDEDLDDDDDNEDDRDEEDLLNGHQDDADQDEDDDDDDDDDDDLDESEDEQDDGEINADSFGHQSDHMIRNVRNQLAPGWSPSRQRIPAASYRGRPQRAYDDGLDTNDPLEHGDSKSYAKHTKGFKSEKVAKSAGLFGTEEEDALSDDDDEGMIDVMNEELHGNFGSVQPQDNALANKSVPGSFRSHMSKTAVAKPLDEEEDDDF